MSMTLVADIVRDRIGLHCFDLLTGDELWFKRHPRPMGTIQPHLDGILYGGRDEPCAVVADTGELIWRMDRSNDLPDEVLDRSPRSEDPVLVTGDYLVNLYVIWLVVMNRHTGKILGHTRVPKVALKAPPVRIGDYIVCGGSNGYVGCVKIGKPSRKATPKSKALPS